MTRRTKILLGAATWWLPVWFVLFVAGWFGMVVLVVVRDEPMQPAPGWLVLFFGVGGATVLLTLVLGFVYVVHLFNNPRVTSDQQTGWMLALLFAGVIAMPLYWYRFIWQEKNQARSSTA